MSAIDDLPTEAMRAAARKLVAILEPLTWPERVALIRTYGEMKDDAQIKAVAASLAHLEQRKN
jgi:hypothetical protein